MTPESIALLVGIFLPILIAFVKKAHYDNRTNAAIAVGVYVVVGVATLLVSGQPLDGAHFVYDIGIVGGAGTVAYNAFWHNFEPQPPATIIAVGSSAGLTAGDKVSIT